MKVEKRILIMSDSHGQFGPLQKIMEMQPDASMYIHLGDSEGGVSMLRKKYPEKEFFCLRGNCDHNSELPDSLVIPVDSGHRIFAAHGHKHAVGFSRDMILEEAEANNCNIVLFGHTHERLCSYDNGVYVINPGSCSCPRDGLAPSFAFIDVIGKDLFVNSVSL